jgi:hypothetical protein
VKTEQDIKSQVSAIRERVKELSGFYIAEGAAMTYALEWVLEKRETVPAGELGRAGTDSQKIVESLTAAAEKAASKSAPASPPRKVKTPPPPPPSVKRKRK